MAKGPRKIVDLAPKDFADGVQQPCNNLDPWPGPVGLVLLGPVGIMRFVVNLVLFWEIMRLVNLSILFGDGRKVFVRGCPVLVEIKTL